MAQMPTAKFLTIAPSMEYRRTTCEKLGVGPERVEFVERLPRKEYLELYQRIDIALDTFPYNGHTTSLDSLWMGVPVVTLCGKSSFSRAGFSQASNLQMTELVAKTRERFVQIAVELAGDVPQLVEIRKTLRQRMEASPLMDAKGFARGIESAYREMWRERCAAGK
jgi:protein O-GlcNAc transferase